MRQLLQPYHDFIVFRLRFSFPGAKFFLIEAILWIFYGSCGVDGGSSFACVPSSLPTKKHHKSVIQEEEEETKEEEED